MANPWYVDATTNAAGNDWSKVWVVQEANPDNNTVAGPYPTEAAAKAGANSIVKIAPLTGWRGTVAVLGGAAGAAGSILSSGSPSSSAIGTGVSAGSAVGSWFQTFSWVQAAEVLLGLVLIAVGVARLTHAVPIATSVAKTVGAVAI